MKGILGVETEELVSVDYKGDSPLFDCGRTLDHGDGRQSCSSDELV
jgi:hypothetical protein